MALLDVLALIELGEDKKYYKGFLRKLKDMSEARGYSFGPPRSEWELDRLAKPRNRTSYIIEGTNSAVVGFVLVPGRREHANKAWNRFEDELRSKLCGLDFSEHEGKRIRVVIIQVWSSIDALILPVQDLEQVTGYMSTGDFTVKKDDRVDFVLYRPVNEGGNIRLDWQLDKVFNYM